MTLPSARDFTDLPSDRSPRSDAARELGRLAAVAVGRGQSLNMRYGDGHRRREYQGEFDSTPGRLLGAQSPEIRHTLAQLTSDDILRIDAQLPEHWTDWYYEASLRSTPTYRRRSSRWQTFTPSEPSTYTPSTHATTIRR